MRRRTNAMADFPPVHPGEILREEFLGPMGISA
jgi:plasmid maintenance system antidote protein VapI